MASFTCKLTFTLLFGSKYYALKRVVPVAVTSFVSGPRHDRHTGKRPFNNAHRFLQVCDSGGAVTVTKLEPLAYHQRVADAVASRERELWHWFQSDRFAEQY